MVEPTTAPGEQVPLLRSQKRSWQLWSALVLGLGLAAIAVAIYQLLRVPVGSWTPAGVTNLVPPLLFGLISLLVLFNYYIAQKEAVIQGLQQELMTQKIEAELNRELALLDPVTEVYNRRYLRVILAKEISRVKRYGKGLAVMLLDITGFRKVNDSLGHTGGDVVLRQIAQLVQRKIRNSDIIVRFGGDEFLLILPDTDDQGLYLLAGRLKDSLRDWGRRSGMAEFDLRFAIGLARYSSERPVDELLRLAEQRMREDRRETTAGSTPAPSPVVGNTSVEG